MESKAGFFFVAQIVQLDESVELLNHSDLVIGSLVPRKHLVAKMVLRNKLLL